MRISDWSSDVCSSDLSGDCGCNRDGVSSRCILWASLWIWHARRKKNGLSHGQFSHAARAHPASETLIVRSEEHTSELQSLMRSSYAVFCLKKKTQSTV